MSGRVWREAAQRFFAREGIACATLQARSLPPALETVGGQVVENALTRVAHRARRVLSEITEPGIPEAREQAK
jgi:hypothetical protein